MCVCVLLPWFSFVVYICVHDNLKNKIKQSSNELTSDQFDIGHRQNQDQSWTLIKVSSFLYICNIYVLFRMVNIYCFYVSLTIFS